MLIIQTLINILFIICVAWFSINSIKYIKNRKINKIKDLILFRKKSLLIFSIWIIINVSNYLLSYVTTGDLDIFLLLTQTFAKLWFIPVLLIMMQHKINKAKSEDDLLLNISEQTSTAKRMNVMRIMLIASVIFGILLGIIVVMVYH